MLSRIAPLFAILCSCGSEGSGICTEIGCADGVSLHAKTPSGSLLDGTYSISMQIDGALTRCSLSATDLSSRSAQTYFTTECDALGASVTLSPQVVCTEHRTEDAVGQSCEPIQGKWEFAFGVRGTPASVRIEVARDGVSLLDQTLTLDYVDTRPNGPQCEPVCRQATPAPLVLSEL